jgi:beta-galactosidase
MKEIRSISVVLICFLFILFPEHSSIAQSREILNMDTGWKFKKGDPAGSENTNFNDSEWRNLNVPHDWSIEGTFSQEEHTGRWGSAFLPTGIAWYRKHFQVTDKDLKRTVWVEFGGAYMNSDVWLNGHHLGSHPYGYTGFYYDLSPYLKSGKNVLAVRVDNSQQPNCRWYSGSGIYRSVNLVKTDPVHFGHWDTYIRTTSLQNDQAELTAEYSIDNTSGTKTSGTIRSELLDSDGKVIAATEVPFQTKAGKQVQVASKIQVPSPTLWSPEQPYLYRLQSSILKDEKIIDNLTNNVGIRKIKFDVDKGFFLNGKQVKINGVGVHHDGGAVGAAVPDDVWVRRLELLKEMGCNAIRTAHNPPSTPFLDLCDKMGFLVLDEAFDEWKKGKIDFGYHLYFDEWAIKDLTTMIKRDRNHPSVIIWSLGNEILEQRDENGYKKLQEFANLAHELDPSRPVTVACDKIGAEGSKGPAKESFLNELDIVGYNYADRWRNRRELYYSLDKLEHPDWKLMGTESRSINGNRGDYSLGDDPDKVQANYNTQMISVEQNWKFVATHDYVIGDFLWTGFDHLGENVWPRKSTYWGIIDYSGFPKDGYYFYKSQWTEEPMTHLFPHWNWPEREGQTIPVICYTNCDTVELFLNGKSLGEKRLAFPKQGMVDRWRNYDSPRVGATTNDLHLSWDVPYEPGTLMAIGKKDGKKVIEQISTTGPSKAVHLKIDKESIRANSRDICHFVVEVVDKKGNVVPDDDHLIQFTLKGPGKILGIGNGDPVDHRSHQSDEYKTYRGLCLVVVQSTGDPGEITLTAESDSLTKVSKSVKSVKNND